MPKACTHRVLRVLVRRPDEKKLQCVKCLKLVHTRHTESLEQRIIELQESLSDAVFALHLNRQECDEKDALMSEINCKHGALKSLYACVRVRARETDKHLTELDRVIHGHKENEKRWRRQEAARAEEKAEQAALVLLLMKDEDAVFPSSPKTPNSAQLPDEEKYVLASDPSVG